jgi:hypothetical protein
MIRPFGLMVHNGEPLFIFADVPRDPMCEKSQLTQSRKPAPDRFRSSKRKRHPGAPYEILEPDHRRDALG